MKLTKLTPATGRKGKWLACMEDGSTLRVGEHQVADFALYTGMELDAERLEKLLAAIHTAALRDRALDCLAVRPFSRRELVKKLVEKEEDPAGAEAVADWLEELGYLNDGAYAKTVVQHYSAKGYGVRKLRDELYRRGVPREYWDGALEEAEGTDEAIDALIAKKLAGCQPDRKELKRVSDALARRGYRWDEINAGLRRYGAQEIDD